MPINTRALAFAAGLTAAATYALCAFFVAVAPDATAALFSYVFHYDLKGSRPLTWDSFLVGLICFSVGVGLTVAVVGALYNRLSQRARSAAPAAGYAERHG